MLGIPAPADASQAATAVPVPDLAPDDVFERPAEVAAALGCSLPTLWRRARDDPRFPGFVRTGPNMVAMPRSWRLEYMRALVAANGARGAP